MSARFEIAGGSVTGRTHALAGRCNQDAYALHAEEDRVAAVVADGCGSGAHSEVGAQLGARIAAAALSRRLAEGARPEDPGLWGGLRDEVIAALLPAARAAGDRLSVTVGEMMLFTLVGIAISGAGGVVFAAGDGIAAVDGEIHRIGPFPGDAPPYLGYGLCDAGAPGLSVIRAFAAEEARVILAGTDGVAALCDIEGGRPLRALWEEDRHFRNKDALRRTLSLHNREEARPIWEERRIARRRGLLEDDATVVVVRRRG